MILTFTLASLLGLSAACTSTTSNLTATNYDSPVTFTAFEIIDNDQTGEATLNAIKAGDRASRRADGTLANLPAEELLKRAQVFAANRLFPQARDYFSALLERFPNHPSTPVALFGMGRAFYQERNFTRALPYFQKGATDAYAATKEGRDCFYYLAPTLLRLDRASEAARQYELYAQKFPLGERFEAAHLNAIDTWREAANKAEAVRVINQTRTRFAGKPTAVNALFARLRLEIAASEWANATRTAEELSRANLTATSTNFNEVTYLRAYALERDGKREAAINAYSSIPDTLASFYGAQATAKLKTLGAAAQRLADGREARVRAQAQTVRAQYPLAFREETLRAVRGRAVDPRFMLAVMRQESSFKERAKSPAAARGLMQLTIDTAARYAPQTGLNLVTEDALFVPQTNLTVAAAYLDELNRMFNDSLEAVAASYNGGEDNAVRWQRRATHRDAGIFASEVGFSETKDYVFKVMANHRAYTLLYTPDLKIK